MTLPKMTCIEEINGQWFCCTDSTSIDKPLQFRDLGNGPELMNDNVYGPFATEAEAIKWLRTIDPDTAKTETPED